MDGERALDRVVFQATLVATMTASSFQIFFIAVLASPLIADVDLSRAELGLIGAVNTFVGAVTAPATGRLTDRIGPRRSVVAVLVISAVGMGAMAAAPTGWWLAFAALIGGIPQGWGNPATNSLIAARVAPGRRGAVTGVKQSGVTLGVFLAGATLPGLANVGGWRGSAATFAVVFAAAAIAVEMTIRPDPGRAPSLLPRRSSTAGASVRPTGAAVPRARLEPFIWRLTLYALLMGTTGGAVGRFFALFAEEAVGFTTEAAGAVVALGGLLGMAARVAVGRLAEHRVAPTRLLGHLAFVGMAYCVVLAVVTPSTRDVLWLTPPLNAVGIAAWNAVAMLAIITYVASADSGHASGVVMFGFLGGLTLGGPVAGWAVDRWDDYGRVWWAAALLAMASAILMWTDRTPGPSEPAAATRSST